MSIGQLLEWQWQGYAKYHQNRTNLLLHIFAVPLFILATVLLVVAAIKLSLIWLTAAIAGVGLSLIIQGRGHKLEPVPPEPFTGVANVIGRLFLEQWVTFPRFVFSGGWFHNWVRANKT